MSASYFFYFHGTKLFTIIYRDCMVLSFELTYNGARDLYASMEQQIQPLNSISVAFSRSWSPNALQKSEVLEDPKHAVYRQLQ